MRLLKIFTIVLIWTFTAASSEQITIKNTSLYPEGISYDSVGKRFFVSSVARGEIWTVSENGKSELFIKDKHFPSTLGLSVDEKHNRLIACISDPGVGKNSLPKTKAKLAAVAIFDLKTKKRLFYQNLALLSKDKTHLVNDVTYDESGNIYVTDSFAPIIYKIDKSGKSSIFLYNEQWGVESGQFGLNGIVYHPKGFLIVANYQKKELYKVDINNPKSYVTIKLSQANLEEDERIVSIDGLLLNDNNTLVLVSNTFDSTLNGNTIYRIVSKDNWKSAYVSNYVKTKEFPTTITKKDDNIYVIHSHLPELFSGNKHPVSLFGIEKISWEKN